MYAYLTEYTYMYAYLTEYTYMYAYFTEYTYMYAYLTGHTYMYARHAQLPQGTLSTQLVYKPKRSQAAFR